MISNRLWRSRITRGVILVVSISLIASVSQSILTLWRKKDLVTERELKLAQEQKKNVKLKEKLRYATTPEFIEQEARTKLGMVREGEQIVLLPQQSTIGNQPFDKAQGKPSAEENLPNWKRWWRLFF